MNRRAPLNAAQDRAAQNQQTIKTLLKLEANKSCADCKRNKHPRWASWNLGVFVCIRCSGIHRGMGTHISRVKSVDLDAWTDEQLQSILRWGNARANKYWESKLAVGHVPSEAKIENFIRTKYESKRWVMDGPMPDPATLDEHGDDDVPLNVVQEKAKLDRASSQRTASVPSQPVPPPPRPPQQIDLFGDAPPPPARPSTTDTPGARAPPPNSSASTKPTKASDSLLGLDFFGGPATSSMSRPASSASNPGGSNVPSRPDLKQSILSLYASAPKPQAAPQHDRQPSFGGMQSPRAQQPSSFGGLDDAFGGLSMSSAPQAASRPPQPVKPGSFASFNAVPNQRSSAAAPQMTSPLSGGGFFDTGPKPTSKSTMASEPTPEPQAVVAPLEANDFGDFSFASGPPRATSRPTALKASNDLFNEPTPAPALPESAELASSSKLSSPFNLSAQTPASQRPPQKLSSATSNTSANFSVFSNSDTWGSNDAWSTPDTVPTQPTRPTALNEIKSPAIAMQNDFSAWGGSEPITSPSSSNSGGFGKSQQAPPRVTPDEDFGGWSSNAPVAPPSSKPPPTQSAPPAGGLGGDDPYSNPWG